MKTSKHTELQEIEKSKLKEFLELKNVIDSIPALSRLSNMSKPLKVINEKSMRYIVQHSNELNEKMYNLGKSDTQTTRKLMSMNMMNTAANTYQIIKQILAQIESKQVALNEAIDKNKKEFIKLKRITLEIDTATNELDVEELEIDKLTIERNISNSMIYIEGALKEIGYLINTYEEILQNKGIDPEWNEEDIERNEVKEHIRNMFRMAVRDTLVTGSIKESTYEYLEQFGISPFEGLKEVKEYVLENNEKLQRGEVSDFDDFYSFLDSMANKYQDNYKKACDKIGITNLISRDFLITNHSEE